MSVGELRVDLDGILELNCRRPVVFFPKIFDSALVISLLFRIWTPIRAVRQRRSDDAEQKDDTE